MFRLKYYYSIVSLVAIVVSAVVLSSYYRQSTIEQLIELEENNYIVLTQTIANTLLPQYREFLKHAESLGRSQLESHPSSIALHNDVENVVHGLPILKIKIFDSKGKTLFSTDPTQTGIVKPVDYPGSKVAITGVVISKISEREVFRRIDGIDIHNRKILSSYLPFYEGSNNKVSGVIEIYSDITETIAAIEHRQTEVIGVVLAILGLLYVALYFFVYRADRILARQHREHKQATELSSRLGRVLDTSSNEIYIIDANSFQFTHVNKGGCDNLGYNIVELNEMTALDLCPEITRDDFLSYINPLRKGECEQANYETVHQRKNGSIYPVAVRLQYSPAENPPVFAAIVLDITEKKKADEQLNFLAYYDNLTGLPNRRLFVDRLEQAMKAADRNKQLVAVLFIDLDQFKKVNDSLGHDAGDILLKDAAIRLKSCVRASDTVARWSGDEFVLALHSIKNICAATVVAEKIVENFSEPFHIKNEMRFITASIGIVLYPSDDNKSENLLKHADTAMYQAKATGRNNYKFYNYKMTARLEERLEMENELRQALVNEEFYLQYQPQVDIETGAIVGIEALIRWQHPQHGLVPPDRFIGIAEETGLIVPLGDWVLNAACKQIQTLDACGLPPIHVSVNLSARELRESNLVQKVDEALKAAGLEPTRLDLEITESMLLDEVGRVAQALIELSALGVNISVDDFGTGYSSLSYLKQFPISTLKIDRSFICDIPQDKDDMSITIAIINMAKALGIKTVAEGVEEKEQLDFLKLHKCDLMQGYYFSKPIDFVEVVKLLQNEHHEAGLAAISAAGQ